MVEHDAHLIPEPIQWSISYGMPKSVEAESHVETDLRSFPASSKPAIVRERREKAVSPKVLLKLNY